MARRMVYGLGVLAVAAIVAAAMWASWRGVPPADLERSQDKLRISVLAAVLAGLPWVARRRGLFGPVGDSLAARLVRVGGCGALATLLWVVVLVDRAPRDLTGFIVRGSWGDGGNVGPAGPVDWAAEAAALALIIACAVTVRIVAARPLTEVMLAIWSCCGIVGAILLVLLPDQMITVGYAAWIFALTARRSPVSPAALGIGGTAGVAGSLIVYGATATALRPGHWLILPVAMLAAPAAAGWATTWRMPDDGTPGADVPDDGGSGEDGGREKLRQARILQGLAAGVVVGTISALLAMILTGDVMVLVGPVLGAAAGAVGGVIGADHPRQRRTSRTWSGGVFVVHWHGHADP